MDFTLLSGTATGGNHIEAASNGQDALSVRTTANSIVVVVADGCSSQPHSEVGAQIIAPMLTAYIEQALRKGQSLKDPRIWTYIRSLILAKILSVATDMAGDAPVAPVLNQYFQFTLVGMVMTPEYTVFFSRGDGMYGFNGKVITIKPEAGNRPAYIVYGLTNPDMTVDNPQLLDFDIHAIVETSDIENWWVGTDGVEEMLAVLGRTVNGEKIATIESLLDDQRYHDNPKLLNRRLQQLVAADLIGDDITLAAGRRTATPDSIEEKDEAAIDPTADDAEGDKDQGKAEAASPAADTDADAGAPASGETTDDTTDTDGER